MKTPSHQRSIAAFTLVEMLAVLSIIAILATLSSVSLTGMMRSNSLAVAADQVAAELSHARTAAIANNNNTDVRIITSTATPCIQTILILNNGTTVPLSRPVYLPVGVSIATNTTYSGFLNLGQQTMASTMANSGAKYRGVRFGPTGVPNDASTGNALTSTNNYLTLVSTQYANNSTLPANWITIAVDVRTGSVRRYQP